MLLPDPVRTTLGRDPTHRTHAINGYAFQQDAIHTFAGWQYTCFYASLPEAEEEEPLFVHLSRRRLPDGPWETFAFEDYAQTVDDGHNTAQLGICPGDGTIHLSYDHHCDVLRYRHSRPGVATSPEGTDWGPHLFTTTLSTLPGLPSSTPPEVAALFTYITYPRFVTLGPNLLFTFRTGKAGLGDDHLCAYVALTGSYKFIGTHLKGVWNNPYIHGLDTFSPLEDNGSTRLYTTWVYREFVEYEGWDDPLDTKHKAQAGPNSAANNRDICFAWSDHGGFRWWTGIPKKGLTVEWDEDERNGDEITKRMVADLSRGESILPTSPGVVAFTIPKGSGLTNQEAQAVDRDGGVHILNRDTLDDDGVLRWRHYYLSLSDRTWTRRALPHIDSGACGGKRGQLAVSRDGDLYFVLPHHTNSTLTIVRATRASRYAEYELVWRGEGFLPTDPLLDKARLLGHDNVLSVFTRALVGVGSDEKEEKEGKADLVVLDFQL